MFLVQNAKLVTGLDPVVPSTSTPDYVSLKDAKHISVVVLVKNATTVTGSAITLKQATAVAGTSEKALAFTKVYRNIDTAAADTLAEATVTSNTFTTDSTNSKNLMYVIEVDAAELDVANGFDCIRAGTGDATAATVTVLYVLSGLRYPQETPPAAITD
jgi:pyridoxal/pyridoxine/pyridoxamine kinase